jgi:hypothetical protein
MMAAKRYLRRLVPAAMAIVPLLATTAAAHTTLEMGKVANLIANGAALGVPLTVACEPVPPGGATNVFVQVRQAAGDVVASGNGFLDALPCDDTAHPIGVHVLADPGSRPFRAGPAVVQASLAVCTNVGGPVELSSTGSGGRPDLLLPAPEPPPPPPAPDPGPVPPPAEPCRVVSVPGEVFVHPMDAHGGHPPSHP